MRGTAVLTAVAAVLLALAAPGAMAAAPDRDRDGLPDRWETKHRLSTKANTAAGDADRDRVDNGNEWRQGTSPRDRDSDDDGRRDGREDADRDGLLNADEDATGSDPIDRDSDDDGVTDGNERAGVISSFKDGALRINLARGGKVSGAVTDETEVACATRADAEGRWLKKGKAKAAEAGDEYDEYDEYAEEEYEYEDEPAYDEDYVEEPEPRDDGSDPCRHTRLKTGAKVREAELVPGPDGPVFARLVLVR